MTLKNLKYVLLTLIAACALVFTGSARADATSKAADARAAREDIKKTLGFVPSFFNAFGDSALPGTWQEMKGLQMNPKTALSGRIKELTAKYNNGRTVDTVNQKLGYLVRCGDPDAIDSIAPMAYGNLALDLLLKKVHGRLVVLKNGHYDNIPIDIVTSTKKTVNVNRFYNADRLRPKFESFEMTPLFIMTSDAL